MVFNVFIYILAGLIAGILTGFSGISAAVVVTPALVALCGFDAYEAVGIAMASDVIASALTSTSYARHGHLRIGDAKWLMISVLVFTLLGSWLGNIVPHDTLGDISVVLTPLMGIKFLFFPQTNLNRFIGEQGKKALFWESIASGGVIGIIAGFVGAGGGEMLLLVLTTLLCYEVKDSVGTGVFIMTFVALVGCASHIYLGGWPDTTAFIICIIGNATGAIFAARLANRINSATLNRIIGVLLVVSGMIMFVANFFL
ncbi:MAG: sulfite exporter TauE/SafE family protein [Oscillospiraceae bacterium]|nr:sulfite exporter TauE/SafE family protein [Oscillospiraceae bacterium]